MAANGADATSGSRVPTELGDDVLRGLIAVRILGRHRDTIWPSAAWRGSASTRFVEVVTKTSRP